MSAEGRYAATSLLWVLVRLAVNAAVIYVLIRLVVWLLSAVGVW